MAGDLLGSAAAYASSSIAAFSGWMLTGFGAALGLLVINYHEIVEYLDIGALRNALFAFLIAFVVALIIRYLATMIVSSKEAREHAHAVGEKAGMEEDLTEDEAIDLLNDVYAEILKASWPPGRWYTKKLIEATMHGDHAVGPRHQFKAAQFAGWLVLVQTIFHLYSVFAIASGLVVL